MNTSLSLFPNFYLTFIERDEYRPFCTNYFSWKITILSITYFELFLRFAFYIKISFDIVSKKMFFIIGMTLEARLLLCTTESVVFCFFGFLLCDWRRSCNNVVHIPLFCIKLVIRQCNECPPKIEENRIKVKSLYLLRFLWLYNDVSWQISKLKFSKIHKYIPSNSINIPNNRVPKQSRIPFLFIHGLQTPCEKITFTARLKINSHSQIFRYGWSIFCLPHQPKFSDLFDFCLHWLSIVCVFIWPKRQKMM